MSRAVSPFSPAALVALLLVGGAAFLLLLYAIGNGLTGNDDRDGGAHAASNSLNGFSALADLLGRQGYDVSLSRSPATMSDEALLVLTPSQAVDADQLERIVLDRQYVGPTILVLPKWASVEVPQDARIEAEEGWVVLLDTWSPEWLTELAGFETLRLATGRTAGWKGLGLAGVLPAPAKAQAITGQEGNVLLPIVTDAEGDLLAGYWNRNGYFPHLARDAGIVFSAEEEDGQSESVWPLVVVAEPDLMNNYALADRERALLAVSLVEATLDGYDLPVVFDLTLPGLGSSQNLLTLAFRPPFLAATVCLLLAALVIAWRGFLRFGPPVVDTPALARGKTQLARNGAGLIERAKRWHLLGPPYAAMVAARIARALHLRETDGAAREAAIDQAMRQREIDDKPFSIHAEALRKAHRPADIMRAASALRTIERMLTR